MATYLFFLNDNVQPHELGKSIGNNAALSNTLVVEPVEFKAIGIDKAKEIIKFTQIKALDNTKKLVIVYSVNKMTEEAQNALLKTLEEHQDFVDIILVAKSEKDILPTVLSRCKKIKNFKKTAKLPKNDKKAKNVQELKLSPFSEKLAFAEKISKLEKDKIVELLENWAKQEREEQNFENAQLLLQRASEIEKLNINTKLALESLFLKIT